MGGMDVWGESKNQGVNERWQLNKLKTKIE